jgi:galactofuranose transport system substrate-binding protein
MSFLRPIKNLKVMVLIFTALSMGLVACGGNNSAAAIHPGCTSGSNTQLVKLTKATKVGWAQNALDGAWRFAEEKSIEDTAAQYGYQLLKTNANDSDNQEVQDIENLINDKVDVLLVDPYTEDAEAKPIQDARKACIPVFVVDRDINHSLASVGRDYVTYIGSDFKNQGVMAADSLIESLGGPGANATIIELQGTTGSSPAVLRGAGFDAELAAKAPNIRIVASQTANFARATGQSVMATLITQYPNIKGVFAHNDEMAIGAITAMKAAGKTVGGSDGIKVVSIDGTKDAINLVVSGEEYAVVSSNPRLGPLTFQTLKDYIDGKEIPDWVIQPDKVYKKADGSAAAYLPDAF